MNNRTAEAAVSQVRRINSRWIVHHGLRETTARWLDHLEVRDPARLEETCGFAMRVMHEFRRLLQDPKPLFYSAVFSRARSEEIANFLKNNTFTKAILRHLHGTGGEISSPLPPEADNLARHIAGILREADRG